MLIVELFPYSNEQDMTFDPDISAASVAKAVIPTTYNSIKNVDKHVDSN